MPTPGGHLDYLFFFRSLSLFIPLLLALSLSSPVSTLVLSSSTHFTCSYRPSLKAIGAGDCHSADADTKRRDFALLSSFEAPANVAGRGNRMMTLLAYGYVIVLELPRQLK